jgi:DNA polymerase III sliding clamp (beta) subunit (PCNA family)
MKASINTIELIRIIKALKPFTRKMDAYYKAEKMEYIYVEFNYETQEARFEALDGHRIAIEYTKCITEESFSAYIKPFNPWKTEALQAELEVIGSAATLDMGHYILRFTQPEGEWYDTKKMIDELEKKEIASKFGINPEYLIEALKNMNSYGCKKSVVIETRSDKREPVIVRELEDRRNIRYILPVNISD